MIPQDSTTRLRRAQALRGPTQRVRWRRRCNGLRGLRVLRALVQLGFHMSGVDQGVRLNHCLLLVCTSPVQARLAPRLSAERFVVTLCESATAGAKALRSSSFDAVIVDASLGAAAVKDLVGQIRSMGAPRPGLVLLDGASAEVALLPGELPARADDPEGLVARLRELAAPDDAAVQEESQSKRPVLLVDDSLTFRSALGDRLRADGYKTALAGSGEEGLVVLPRSGAMVAIVDLVMPGIDGLETCRRMRASEKGAHIPILMLTASDDIPARVRGRAAGASEFLVKAADFDAVVAGVRDFIRRTTAKRRSAKAVKAAPSGGSTPLFAHVVHASGLAPVLAEQAITRACARAGVDSKRMAPADLERALPHIERSLRMFLAPHDVPRRFEAVAALIGRSTRLAQGAK